ncbi:MAG TPA: MMPL family transporter [Steroidobacter sp.]|uniref:MMPL family transporter n=1 Tax=Steroidobacter sp. TaxID=1978227 RepID=UPI002EDA121B
MFSSLGRFAFRYRWLVLLAAGIFMVVAIVWGSGVFGLLTTGGLAPEEAEVSRANELLEEHFGRRPGDMDAVVVFDDESGTRRVDDAEFARPVRDALAALPASEVMSVVSYWTPGLTPEQRAEFVSPDRHATYAVITLQGEDDAARLKSYGQIQQAAQAGNGIATYLACGCAYELQREATANLATSQAISLPILLVLLVVFYRGLVAALIPLALGVFAILGSLVILRLLTMVTDISIFALEIVVLVGLGLAVDYGLFIVSRFREELERGGGNVAAAVIATTSTAGRTVAISGLTVISGLSGLLLFPQPISHSFGLGGISVVFFNVIAALLVLPATLAILGARINAGRLPLPRLRRTTRNAEDGRWARLAAAVTKRPAVSLTLGVLVLLIAAAPLLGTRPGLTNHRYLPVDNHAQIVARYMNEEFPPNGPGATALDVAVRGPVDPTSLDAYVDRLAQLPGTSEVRVHLSDPAVTWVKVNYDGEADDPGPLQLVRDVRATPPPSGAEVLVGGQGGAAMSLDNNAATLASLPGALGLVAVVTFLLIALAFRSVLIPIKAVICAFLSLAASLGIVVWAFQEGGLAGLLGFQIVGTTDLWTLGLITTIAFGLVTDYEMFLVSRMREVYVATGDNTRAVAIGLQQTGSIITRAAILMIVVLATMGLTAGSLFIITFGIGMTLSVIIDATIVRSVIVPAAMQLLGAANWWAPRPLAWLSDRLGLSEGMGMQPRPDTNASVANGERLPT